MQAFLPRARRLVLLSFLFLVATTLRSRAQSFERSASDELEALMAEHPRFSVPLHPSDYRSLRELEVRLRFLGNASLRDLSRRASSELADDGEAQLRRGAVAVGPSQLPELDETMGSLAESFGLDGRRIGLYVFGEREFVASSWGWTGRRPVVALSSALVEELPPERLRFVLAYEAAHLAAGHVELKALCSMLSAVDDTVSRELRSIEKEAYKGIREELKRNDVDVTRESFWADLLHVSKGALNFLPVATLSREVIKGLIGLMKKFLHERIAGYLGLWRIDADRSACRGAFLHALCEEGSLDGARRRVIRSLLSLMLASPRLADRVDVEAFLAQVDGALADRKAKELVLLGAQPEGKGRLAAWRRSLARFLDGEIRSFFKMKLSTGLACDNTVAVLQDLFLFAEGPQCADLLEFHRTADPVLRGLHVLRRADVEYGEACEALNGRQDECMALRDLLARSLRNLLVRRLLEEPAGDEALASLLRRSEWLPGGPMEGHPGGNRVYRRLLASLLERLGRRDEAEAARALAMIRERLDEGKLAASRGHLATVLRAVWPDLPPPPPEED